MSDRFIVNEKMSLLLFLNTKLKDWSRNKIKQRLKTGCIFVGGQSITQHNYTLNVGNQVEVRASIKGIPSGSNRLEVLYSDKDLIAINKPAGLLSVASASENKVHAHAMLRNQLSRPKRPVKLWPVHRLDRDTSGVLLFATSREMREAVNKQWSRAEKTYFAIVEGCPSSDQGTIDQPLWMDPDKYHMNVGSHPEAKNAITHFKVLKTTNNRSLLEVQIETGRQHQIRAHLSWLGCSVVGDPRYGSDGSRLGLHALRLSIRRPDTDKLLTFETPPPNEFLDLFQTISNVSSG